MIETKYIKIILFFLLDPIVAEISIKWFLGSLWFLGSFESVPDWDLNQKNELVLCSKNSGLYVL